jgi:hypothetical protein
MPRGKAKVSGPLKSLITLRGEPEWLEWLKRYADHLGVQATNAIDIALREQAKRDRFNEPMPKRFSR